MSENICLCVLRKAAELYGFDPAATERIPGHEGGRNTVFRLGTERVLRISGLSDRTEQDYLAETEYVRFLAENGAPVADVCPSVNGRLAEILEARGGEMRCRGFPERAGRSDRCLRLSLPGGGAA